MVQLLQPLFMDVLIAKVLQQLEQLMLMQLIMLPL